MEDESIFTLVIIFLILIIFTLDDVLISLGENGCWSLGRLRG